MTLTHVCGTIVTIGEQKVCPESESLKFSTTPTPQVGNPSDSDSTTLIAMTVQALTIFFKSRLRLSLNSEMLPMPRKLWAPLD